VQGQTEGGKLETRNWKLGDGTRSIFDLPFSNFQFPFSSFRFPGLFTGIQAIFLASLWQSRKSALLCFQVLTGFGRIIL